MSAGSVCAFRIPNPDPGSRIPNPESRVPDLRQPLRRNPECEGDISQRGLHCALVVRTKADQQLLRGRQLLERPGWRIDSRRRHWARRDSSLGHRRFQKQDDGAFERLVEGCSGLTQFGVGLVDARLERRVELGGVFGID